MQTNATLTEPSSTASLNKFSALCLLHAMVMDGETTTLLTWNDFLNWGDLPMSLNLNLLSSDTCDVQQTAYPEMAMCQVVHVSTKHVAK